jgi:hypothetical protein
MTACNQSIQGQGDRINFSNFVLCLFGLVIDHLNNAAGAPYNKNINVIRLNRVKCSW